MKVVGIAEPDAATRAAAATRFATPTYASAEALFAAGPLDAVFICVPPHQHGTIEELALSSQTAMFIEKPLAHDLETAEALANRLEEAVPTAIGYHWRQLSFLREIEARLAERDLNLVISTWMSRWAAASWWGDIETAGGQVVEQATHLIDLSLALAGPIDSVLAAASAPRVHEPTGFHKASTALARFTSGAVGCFLTTCVLADPHRRSLELFSDGLAISITDRAALIVDGRDDVALSHEGPDLYSLEQSAFLELVTRGRTTRPLVTYRDALLAHRAAFAIEATMADGVPRRP